MNRKLLFWFALSLVILLLFWTQQKLDLTVLRNASVLLIVAAFSLSLLSTALYVLGVSVLLRGMGYRTSLRRLYLAITAGGTATAVTPIKFGIPVRIALYRQLFGMPVSAGIGSMVLEVVVLLVSMALVLIPYSVWGAQRDGPLVVVGLAVAVAMMLISVRLDLVSQWLATIRFRGLGARLASFANSYAAVMRQISKTHLFAFLAMYVVRHLVDALCFYFVLQSFASDIGIVYLLYVSVLSYMVGTLSMIPMGLGSRDITTVLLLVRAGASQEVAVASTAAMRVFYTFVPLMRGLISINILGLKVGQKTLGPRESR